jgi:hypothetical protein
MRALSFSEVDIINALFRKRTLLKGLGTPVEIKD